MLVYMLDMMEFCLGYHDQPLWLLCVAFQVVLLCASSLHSLRVLCSSEADFQQCIPREGQYGTYPCNNFLNSLFVAFHVQEGFDLTQSKVFSISKSNQLVKGAK